MASLPSLHPTLTLHLVDQTLTPIVSSTTASGPNSTRAAAATYLSRTALAAYNAAQRLEMGAPQRVVVECQSVDGGEKEQDAEQQAGRGSQRSALVSSGPVVLASFIEPPGARGTVSADRSGGASSSSSAHDVTTGAGASSTAAASGEQEEGSNAAASASSAAPLLVGIVVATDLEEHGSEARRAAARLERVGREVQAALIAEEEHRRRIGDDGSG
ncbi:hypothetical protein VTK73DRAFT_1656 [Phialemonium thermophilum]|uniref:Uncharacterized protein n=1 Tax=Phialemonium thermophilum TaxID=223376 RepID=A0ABR3VT58_9PEZI